MKPTINVQTTSVDEQRYFARIRGVELERIVAEAVAKAAGINLDNEAVKIDRIWITRTDAVGYGSTPEAEVHLIVDRSKLPQPG